MPFFVDTNMPIAYTVIQTNYTRKLNHSYYLRYFNYAKQLYEWGVHKPDCKIVVDAHDCAATHDDLIFVSADKNMIEKIISHDTSFLNIMEFKSCN